MSISDETTGRDRYQFQKVQYRRFRKTVLIYRSKYISRTRYFRGAVRGWQCSTKLWS